MKTLELEELAKGKGIGVPGLNRNSVHALLIKIHSLSDQEEIVSEIEAMEIIIQKLEVEIAVIKDNKKQILIKYL
jgi:restriction endonuclease S subunit